MDQLKEIQRKKQESAQPIQQKESGSQTMSPPPFALSAEPVQRKESNGAVPQDVMGKMESTMGMDFGNVNIHANSSKASEVGALAYTQGTDIHFAPGQFNPGSQSGQELLGHELAHVKQQSEGRVAPNGQVGGMPLNDEKHLEHEADQMGAKAAASQASAGASQMKKAEGGSSVQLKKASVGGNAPVQRFKMRDGDTKKYPKFSAFIAKEMPKNINDPRLVKYLNLYGTNQGDSKRDVQSDLAWGTGPEVIPYSLPVNGVSFASNRGSEVIRLSREDIENYEKNETFQQEFHQMVLESNILNGYTQFLDDQDGKDLWGKEGKMLEKAEFGRDIETTMDAHAARFAIFGQGEWEVTVEQVKTDVHQRVVLFNCGEGNGQYDVKTGDVLNVKSRAMNNWTLRPEYSNAGKDGKDIWKKTETTKHQVGKNEYLVRGEVDGDKDRGDMILKVKKKGDKGA
jgi:hypothetical protein